MQVLHLRAATLGGHDPYERVGDDLGPDVVRDRDQERDDLPRQDVAVSIDITLELDLTYESGARATPQAKVEKPWPGDRDVGDTVAAGEVGSQDLGDLPCRPPGGPRQLQRDVRGVVPTPTRPRRRHHRPYRHDHVQLPLVHGTAHRAQHGTGELDGGHGTSVGEEGGG
jgi:hypothetical protein